MRAPLHLWIIGGLSLAWNLIGAADYTLTQTRTGFYIAQFTPEQISYFTSFPTWVVAAWATAVWTSVAGSLLLLLRSGWAVAFFALSLAAMLVTTLHNYVLDDVRLSDIAGPEALWFSLAIAAVALGEWLYARKMRQTGVIG